MKLRDEIIKEAESRENGFVVISGDYAFSEEELDHIIRKVGVEILRRFDGLYCGQSGYDNMVNACKCFVREVCELEES